MKKIVVFLVVAVLLVISGLTAFAASYATHMVYVRDDNNKTWQIDTRDGTIVYAPFKSHLVIPAELGGYKITALGDGLFEEEKNYASITVSEGITKIGNAVFKNCKYIPEIILPDSIEYIGDEAFYNCESLENIKLPKNLEYIGKSAFYCCEQIKEITIPEKLCNISDYAFCSCSNLSVINLHDNIKSIGDSAFVGTNVSELFLSDNIENIGINPFYNTPWSDLYDVDFFVVNNILIKYRGENKDVVLPKNVYYISESAFAGSAIESITLHDKLKEIGDYAFRNTRFLSKVDIPESVIKLGIGVFDGSGVTDVTLPQNITKIPDYTFANSKISTLELSSNITEIGDYAYSNSTGFSGTVTLPDSVKKIGKYAFENMTKITGFELNGDVEIGDYAFYKTSVESLDSIASDCTKIGEYAFYMTPWWNAHCNDDFVIVGNGVLASAYFNDTEAEFVIPEGVKTIAGMALNVKCKKIICPSTLKNINSKAFGNVTCEEIVLPDSVEYIGDAAFQDCKNVTKINWPSNLKKVPAYAFYQCYFLTEINLDGVEEIGDYAFYKTAVLRNKGVLPMSVRKLGSNVFNGGSNVNYYLNHIPEEVSDDPFGNNEYSKNTYIHIPEDILDHNPYWNSCSFVIHSTPEITEYGEDWFIVYFKYGVDNDILYYTSVRERLGFNYYENMEILDDNRIKFKDMASYTGEMLDFEEMMSTGWSLVQYESIKIVGMGSSEINASISNLKIKGEFTGVSSRLVSERTVKTQIKFASSDSVRLEFNFDNKEFAEVYLDEECTLETTPSITVSPMGTTVYIKIYSQNGLNSELWKWTIGFFPELAAPVISPTDYYFRNTLDLKISHVDSNAKIYYTLDGTLPALSDDNLYTEPVVITDDAYVHAISARNCYSYGESYAQYYKINPVISEIYPKNDCVVLGVSDCGNSYQLPMQISTDGKTWTAVTAELYDDAKFKICNLNPQTEYYVRIMLQDDVDSEVKRFSTSLAPDGYFSYNEQGEIVAYTGSDTYIEVPSVINDITITSIAPEAFPYGFITVVLPETIEKIDAATIKSNTTFEVSKDNMYLCAENGVLYSKDKTVLVCCALGQKGGLRYEVPDSVKEIGDYAFYNSELAELILNDGLEKIGDGLIGINADIPLLKIPSSVKYIGKNASNRQSKVIVFEGEVPKLSDGTVSENVQLFSNNPTGVYSGYTVRKRLTDDGIYVLYKPSVSETATHLTLNWYCDKVYSDAAIITEITYKDGSEKIYFTDITEAGSMSKRFSETKEIQTARCFIWDKNNLKPMSYKESL